MSKIDFANWLREELEKRAWTQAELARQSKISPAQVTRLLNGERGIGENGIVAIAHALKLPPETVFRAAGLLPPQSSKNERIEQAVYLMDDLPEQEQEDILEFIKLRHRLAEDRGIHESRRPEKRTIPTE